MRVQQADGSVRDEVQLMGSIVPLATITTNTVITAGSITTLLARGSRNDYKNVRGTMRLTANGTIKMQLYLRAGDSTTATATTDMFSLSSSDRGSGEARVDGEWWDVGLYNNGASDVTVQYAQIVGVR